MKKYIIIFSILFVTGCSNQTTTETFSSLQPNTITTQKIKNKKITPPVQSVTLTPAADAAPPIQLISVKQNKTYTIPQCVVWDDFGATSPIRWTRVNDNVMGGRSQGRYEINNNILKFFGSTNTNGGGFASIRAQLDPGLLMPYTSLIINAKTDGRRYDITFQDNNQRRISHRTTIPLSQTDDFQEIKIPFADLSPAFFGRRVTANSFQKNQAREIGIIINDGLDGSFQLEIENISLCKT